MTDIPDYLEQLGATVRANQAGCGISLKSQGDVYPTGGWFPEVRTADLRSAINQAMDIAVVCYTECVAKASFEFTPSQILEVSFRVVLSTISARWALSRQLSFEIADLRATRAIDCCCIYCEMKFGANYIQSVAALMDMSLEELTAYERTYYG